MFRKLMAAFATIAVACFAATGFAFAAVDVNSADQAQLEAIKGIGPVISAKIIAERKKGNFKDWADLETRVSGIGDKNSIKLSEGGLTVGGRAKSNAPAMEQAATKTTNKKVETTTPMAPAATDTSSNSTAKSNSKVDTIAGTRPKPATPVTAVTKSTTATTTSDTTVDTKASKATATKKDGKADSAMTTTETKVMTKPMLKPSKAEADAATTETKTTKSKSKSKKDDTTSTDTTTTTKK